MTIARMAAKDEDTVVPVKERAEDKRQVHTTGAHYPDDPQIRGVLDT